MAERKDDILLENHIQEEMARYAAIEERLDKIEIQMAQIIEIWNQAKGVLNFIKALAWIGGGITAIWAFVQSNLDITVK